MAVGDEAPGADSTTIGTYQLIAEDANAARRSEPPTQAHDRRFSVVTAEKFPRAVRIVRSSDYQAIYKTGFKIHSSHFVLFSRGNTLGHSRLGITASRKVGGAVVRNRAKRMFREIFRRLFNQIPNRFDMVINAKSNCHGVSYEDLRTEFLTAVKKLADRYSG
jgi:ribonuclease P protein component